MKRARQWIDWLFGSACFWVGIIVLELVVAGAISWVHWDELREGDSLGSTVRNIGLVIAGLIALPVAIWRGIAADRQSKATQSQVETAQHSLLNERYQKGAEMLGNKILSVRLGGIYALQRLAEEYPEQYHIQIMQLFCQFVCYPTNDEDIMKVPKSDEWVPPMREDVEAVITAISNRNERQVKVEEEIGFRPDLSYVKLQAVNIVSMDLSELIFRRTDFCGSVFRCMNLSGIDFSDSQLCKVAFINSDLSDACFTRANLSGAIFDGTYPSGRPPKPAINLTQAQLDVAFADPDNPPKLEGLIDPDTKQPLVWRGKAPPKD